MNGYELSRNWFNFCFENPEKVKPLHTAIFFFALEHCNRLGGKDKFGFPSQMTMDAIGIKKYQTYGKGLNDLADWGFITFIERSKNQYSANIISINAVPKNGIARGKALDKATIKHGSKHGQSTGQGMDSIDKPINQEPLTIERGKSRFSPPSLEDVENYFFVKTGNKTFSKSEAEVFYNHFTSNGWKVSGKAPMKDWKASINNWIIRSKKNGTIKKQSDRNSKETIYGQINDRY